MFRSMQTQQAQNQKDFGDDDVEYMLPNSTKELRPCSECGMIKAKEQWKQECQNCGEAMPPKILQGKQKKNRIFVGLIHPRESAFTRIIQFPTQSGKVTKAVYGIK